MVFSVGIFSVYQVCSAVFSFSVSEVFDIKWEEKKKERKKKCMKIYLAQKKNVFWTFELKQKFRWSW